MFEVIKMLIDNVSSQNIYTVNNDGSIHISLLWDSLCISQQRGPAWRVGVWDASQNWLNHIWFSFRHFLGLCQQPRHFNGYNKPQSLITSLLYVWKLRSLQLNIQSRLTPRPDGRRGEIWTRWRDEMARQDAGHLARWYLEEKEVH